MVLVKVKKPKKTAQAQAQQGGAVSTGAPRPKAYRAPRRSYVKRASTAPPRTNVIDYMTRSPSAIIEYFDPRGKTDPVVYKTLGNFVTVSSMTRMEIASPALANEMAFYIFTPGTSNMVCNSYVMNVTTPAIGQIEWPCRLNTFEYLSDQPSSARPCRFAVTVKNLNSLHDASGLIRVLKSDSPVVFEDNLFYHPAVNYFVSVEGQTAFYESIMQNSNTVSHTSVELSQNPKTFVSLPVSLNGYSQWNDWYPGTQGFATPVDADKEVARGATKYSTLSNLIIAVPGNTNVQNFEITVRAQHMCRFPLNRILSKISTTYPPDKHISEQQMTDVVQKGASAAAAVSGRDD